MAIWAWRFSAVEVPASAPQLADEVLAVMRDRLLTATVVGLSLGAAGVLLRTATRNPLADPEITGVNSGAAFGAVAVTTAGMGQSSLGVLPGAFLGGALAAAITVGLGLGSKTARLAGAASIQRMVLLGIAVSALFSALTSIFLVLDEAQLATVLSWLSGRIGGVRLPEVTACAIAAALMLPLALAMGRGFDLLAAGDETAASVGAHPQRLRIVAIAMAVFLVAPAVAAVGPIGFLGLMAATFAQRVCGTRHRLSLVAAPLVGAVVLLVADALAQALWAPAETPVGIVTSLAGVPLLLWGISTLRKGGR
ncbi:FecCD family ABC transporter permease [Corynebacterium liangguodongii]|uniref:FecCD family ABC transporter permease n=1 Tax=Corynebacterium liangguodongii TaxID=2079535 RepID=UPI001F2BA5A7|nr:iron ABC transporter permease [Corynebacterium liangguodongii]